MSAANNHENKNGEEEEKSPYLLEFQVLHDLGQKPFEKIIKATLYNDRDKLLQISLSDDGPELMQDVNKLFTFFKSKANKEKELMEYLENLEGLGETQKEFLNRIFIEERQKLIDTQKLNFYKNLPILRTFNWRFEVEVSSRERKKSFIPNFLMNFGFIKYGKVKEDGEQEEIVSDLCVNSDFGTLEKVHQDFKDITHFPRSISYRKMTRGVQRLADQF